MLSKAAGVLICEVKDKGHTWEAAAATAQEQQQRDAAVAKEMRKAAGQLNDIETVGHALHMSRERIKVTEQKQETLSEMGIICPVKYLMAIKRPFLFVSYL